MKRTHRQSVIVALASAVLSLTPARLAAQRATSGAELQALVNGLTVTARVLVVGMHPDDEDSQLLAYLARGHHVQVAYLSVTRGESAGNFLGPASGTTLAAARTQETLAARRIDGAEQFFTRMYDVGYARSDSELFSRWNRDSLVGDIVTVIRSFRPHVIVVNTPDSADDDVQHRALFALVTDARNAAAKGDRYRPLDFGDPWGATLFRRGAGDITMDADSLDPVLGETYAAIAERARAQYRTQGLLDLTKRPSPLLRLAEILPPSGTDTTRGADGVLRTTVYDSLRTGNFLAPADTSLSRLRAAAPPEVARVIPPIAAHADSARQEFDVKNPAASVEHLARLATLVASARNASPTCRHPTAVVAVQPPRGFECSRAELDLDASLDLMSQRSSAALLAAAAVEISATTDRELVAQSDTAPVTIRIANHGASAVALNGVSVWGDVDTTTATATILPGKTLEVVRRITGISDRYNWWMGMRDKNRYLVPVSSLDGVIREPRIRTDTAKSDPAAMRANGIASMMMSAGIAVPEELHRLSDATVTLTVAGTAVTVSLGAVVYRYADAVVGLQERPIAGVPDVTLNLNRALAFVPAGQKLDRGMHVTLTSHTSEWSSVSLRVVTPPGVRDSLSPNGFRLAPRDQRDLVVQLRGTMEPGEKQPFGVVASIKGRGQFADGFRTTQYAELLPIRVSWQSGMWLQPVEITVPKTLTVVYVAGVSDDIPTALQDVGVSVANIPPADLLSVNLKGVTTVVFGPRAFEAHPELLLQMPRFMNWARTGGTVVVLRGGPQTLSSGALPHFVDLGTPATQRVSDPAASVTRVATAPTILQWPNIIGIDDWNNWISERAPFAPTQVDPQYQHVIETHNAGDTPNTNSILLSRTGKGLFIYSALTLDEQIAAGVPGALRLMVNLLSAGLTPPGAR